MTLRFEIFPDDLDVIADFYQRVLDLQERPWGLTEFRILDPAGYYLRLTDRAPA